MSISRAVLASLPETGQLEAHIVSTLARRVLTSRDTVRNLLASSVLMPLSKMDHGHGTSYVFHSSVLDAQRQKSIDAVSRRVAALAIPEQEKLIVHMHAMRTLKKLEN